MRTGPDPPSGSNLHDEPVSGTDEPERENAGDKAGPSSPRSPSRRSGSAGDFLSIWCAPTIIKYALLCSALPLSLDGIAGSASTASDNTQKKCVVCGTTTTPQWRTGAPQPLNDSICVSVSRSNTPHRCPWSAGKKGFKKYCNACGVSEKRKTATPKKRKADGCPETPIPGNKKGRIASDEGQIRSLPFDSRPPRKFMTCALQILTLVGVQLFLQASTQTPQWVRLNLVAKRTMKGAQGG